MDESAPVNHTWGSQDHKSDIEEIERPLPSLRIQGISTPTDDQIVSSNLDVETDDDSFLYDSSATEASVYEAVLAQKDDEIRLLKSQLSQKDDLLRRKENENRKIETKLFDSQEVLTTVTKILTNNNTLQHVVIPEVRNTLKNEELKLE